LQERAEEIMGASCYLCEQNYGTITGKDRADAVGACKLCGVLACLAHGIRNPNRPAYVCGCCVPNLLAVAAVKRSGSGESPTRTPPSDTEPSPDAPSGFSQWAREISKVEDVIGDLADEHWAWLRDDMEYLSRLFVNPRAPAALRAYARSDADQARALMAAAAAIATKMNLPAHEMIPVLQQVAQSVKVNV
jgi:hypothetical protein